MASLDPPLDPLHLEPVSRMNGPGRGTAATFLDFDGTLAATDLVRTCAFFARHAGTGREAAGRTLRLALDVPRFLALDRLSRERFAERLFGHYAGLSEDRLERLADRCHEEMIRPNVFPGVPDFLDGCRAEGPIVLVTGAPDFTVRRFATEYGIDHVVANRLEFVGGVATGRLVPPSVFGSNKARLALEYADEHGIDLRRSRAYADSVNDAALLNAVGRGGVVNPDRRLAAMAKEAGWAVLEW